MNGSSRAFWVGCGRSRSRWSVVEDSPWDSIWELSFHHKVLAEVGAGAIPGVNSRIVPENCQVVRELTNIRAHAEIEG